ncbi:cytochrome c oxidase subunit 8A, mitochondrial [Oryzias melastigma]|uniref:Cytochrome c oxidase subunit 8A, mitochondrial-like n=1 Tax=Oryzias melastigma TaxID=30732 RepID=A0A3B3BLP2_ORYME|nr:cytochrome c oxidase subunit 8A, mitochondrial [Oryzias melastigma]
MPALLRTIARRAAHALRSPVLRANMYSKPPKENIGVVETTIGMGVFTLTILGPSGWILAHLEDYKKKE